MKAAIIDPEISTPSEYAPGSCKLRSLLQTLGGKFQFSKYIILDEDLEHPHLDSDPAPSYTTQIKEEQLISLDLPSDLDLLLQAVSQDIDLEEIFNSLVKYCLCYKQECFNLLESSHKACKAIVHISGPQALGRLSPAEDYAVALSSFQSALEYISSIRPSPNHKTMFYKLDQMKQTASNSLYYSNIYPPGNLLESNKENMCHGCPLPMHLIGCHGVVQDLKQDVISTYTPEVLCHAVKKEVRQLSPEDQLIHLAKRAHRLSQIQRSYEPSSNFCWDPVPLASDVIDSLKSLPSNKQQQKIHLFWQDIIRIYAEDHVLCTQFEVESILLSRSTLGRDPLLEFLINGKKLQEALKQSKRKKTLMRVLLRRKDKISKSLSAWNITDIQE